MWEGKKKFWKSPICFWLDKVFLWPFQKTWYSKSLRLDPILLLILKSYKYRECKSNFTLKALNYTINPSFNLNTNKWVNCIESSISYRTQNLKLTPFHQTLTVLNIYIVSWYFHLISLVIVKLLYNFALGTNTSTK